MISLYLLQYWYDVSLLIRDVNDNAPRLVKDNIYSADVNEVSYITKRFSIFSLYVGELIKLRAKQKYENSFCYKGFAIFLVMWGTIH